MEKRILPDFHPAHDSIPSPGLLRSSVPLCRDSTESPRSESPPSGSSLKALGTRGTRFPSTIWNSYISTSCEGRDGQTRPLCQRSLHLSSFPQNHFKTFPSTIYILLISLSLCNLQFAFILTTGICTIFRELNREIHALHLTSCQDMTVMKTGSRTDIKLPPRMWSDVYCRSHTSG